MPAVILSLPSADVSTRLAAQPLAPPHVPLPHAPTVAALQPLPGPYEICGMQMPPLSPLDTMSTDRADELVHAGLGDARLQAAFDHLIGRQAERTRLGCPFADGSGFNPLQPPPPPVEPQPTPNNRRMLLVTVARAANALNFIVTPRVGE